MQNEPAGQRAGSAGVRRAGVEPAFHPTLEVGERPLQGAELVLQEPESAGAAEDNDARGLHHRSGEGPEETRVGARDCRQVHIII